MWQHLKTFVSVTIVACLIWIYAEGENVKSQPLDVDIQFVPPAGRQLLVKPAQPQRVRLIVRCGTAKYAQVERLARGGPIQLVVRDDPSAADSRSVVVLKDRLANSPLGALGVNIIEVQPQTIPVTAEALKTVTLPVEIVSGDVQLTWTAEPGKVDVGVPESLAAGLTDAKAEARLDPKVLTRLEPNVPHTFDVPLSPSESLRNAGVTLDLPRVKVTIKVRKQTETVVVPLVPVLIMGPPTELARFSVVLSKDNLFLHDIALTGPSDATDRIRKGEVRVTACLTLTAEDLEKGVTKESVTFTPAMNLPPGVALVEAPAPLTCKILKASPEPAPIPH